MKLFWNGLWTFRGNSYLTWGACNANCNGLIGWRLPQMLDCWVAPPPRDPVALYTGPSLPFFFCPLYFPQIYFKIQYLFWSDSFSVSILTALFGLILKMLYFFSFFQEFQFPFVSWFWAKCKGSRNLVVTPLCLLFTFTTLLCIHRFPVTLHPTIILALTINQSPFCHQEITFLIFSVVTCPSLYVARS